MRSPMSSCKKIQATLRLNGTEISLSTVSKRLSKEFGLKSRKPARKPRLTPVMKKRDWTFHKCTIFMQDGAPCHRSKVATDFLKKN